MSTDDLLNSWLDRAGKIARKGIEEAQRTAKELANSPEGRQLAGVAEEGLTEIGRVVERLAATPEAQQVIEVAEEVVTKVGEGAQAIARDLQGGAESRSGTPEGEAPDVSEVPDVSDADGEARSDPE